LKIFLIAIVWAWVTVLLPAVQEDQLEQWSTWGMSLERSLFIFAITLPFDIRDLKVDERSNVKTIPHFLGVKGSVYLGIISTILALATAFILYQLSIYSLLFFIGLSLSYSITALVIFYSQKVRHDYYFSGLTDGLMLIQLLAVLIIFL
jgi:4-hydroxybenzoate polyprenyltransferase